jgi:hypothetical protein
VTECLGLKSTRSFIGPGSRFAGGGRKTKRSLRREQPRRRNVRREGQQRRTFVTNRPLGLPLPWLPFLLLLLQASPYQFDVKKWSSELFRAVPGVVNLSKRRSLQAAEEAFDHCVQGWRHSSQICARRPALKSSFLTKPVAFRGLPFAPLKSVSPKKHVDVSPVCMAAASDAEGASLPE